MSTKLQILTTKRSLYGVPYQRAQGALQLIDLRHILPFEEREVSLSLDLDNLYILVSELISHSLASTLNPLVFMMSGFLFFVERSEMTPELYRTQHLSRWHSLAIPYILWIAITILSNLARAHFPLCFLRGLTCMCLISPLIYYWVKYTKFVGILILYALYLLWIESGLPGFSTTAITAFSSGACLAMQPQVRYSSMPSILYISPRSLDMLTDNRRATNRTA